ncbi:NAD(P)/FAD-dependent oxidoreductase [Salinarimonas ramus]|uniref:FAD-dependent oxidoreductase n=1 Tax=Salinarimonas ramus TaxID=690164 RepID=A0A917Q7S2_9HYPH|nr:FAD-binding oxidoreductase [Salinarimonas ramus]GGK33967.1 FAD-dependent oxidoreductase [Salinarimonas ramus]
MTSPEIPTSETADVLVVGGAAMGSSLAYHLLAHPGFSGRVVVVEKDPTYRLCASALSAASIRSQFSSPVNVRISLHGIRFLRAIAEHLAVEGEVPEIGLKEGGYLYLATAAGADVLRENHAVQIAEGADVALLDPDTLVARFPWLNPGEDVVMGSLGLSGEGWFDGWGLLQAFRRKAKALGAHYVAGEVVDVLRGGPRVTGVVLADGRRIACGTLVNCAGAGGRTVAAMAGVDLPVFARRRYVFTFSCRGDVPNCPLMIDTSGVYVRPEGESADGRQFICGVSPDAVEDEGLSWRDEDPASQDVDWTYFEERIWPALAARVPAFEAIRPGAAWAGPYDMCALDHNALLGPAAPQGPENFLLCNGFSGHGLQQSPAVGRGLAEWIVEGRYATLDLSDLAFARIAEGRRVVERNVI